MARIPGPCKIEGCEKPANVPGTAHGWCSGHYQRWKRYGDPLGSPEYRNKGKTCSYDGCGKPAKQLGLCSAHETRLRRRGTLELTRVNALAPPDMKWCPTCAVYKPVAEFGTHRSSASGLSAWCRACVNAYAAEMRRKYPRKYERGSGHRARRYGAEREPYDRLAIAERDGWICGICGGAIDPSLRWPHRMSFSIDHVVPLSRCGADTPSNVQAAHLSCNASKRDREEVAA